MGIGPVSKKASNARAPGPRGLDVIRAIRDFQRDPLAYLIQLHRYGGIVRTDAGPYSIHTFYDPHALRHVFVDCPDRFTKRGVIDDLLPILRSGLLSSEGLAWRKRRDTLTPGLSRKGLAAIVSIMDKCIAEHISRWRRGDEIDALHEMMHIALRVVGHTLLGVDPGERTPQISIAVEQVSRLAYVRTQSFVKLPLWAPTPSNRAYRRAIDLLREFVDDIIAQGKDRTSFMALLREATAGDHVALRDEVTTFLLAGHETTATTLAWTLAHLGQDDALQERARVEALHALENGDFDARVLDGIELIDAIVSESLRLYPPGWMLARRSQETDEILGYRVPRGSFCVAPIYALHRLPEHWDEPDRFAPDRFLEKCVRNPFVYMPFGAGPRRCIGETFARMETRIVLARLLTRFRLQTLGAVPSPLPLTTLRPGAPVRIGLS